MSANNYSNININGNLINLAKINEYIRSYTQTMYTNGTIGRYITWTSTHSGKEYNNRALETAKNGIILPIDTKEIKLGTGDRYRGRYDPLTKIFEGSYIIESYVDL